MLRFMSIQRDCLMTVALDLSRSSIRVSDFAIGFSICSAFDVGCQSHCLFGLFPAQMQLDVEFCPDAAQTGIAEMASSGIQLFASEAFAAAPATAAGIAPGTGTGSSDGDSSGNSIINSGAVDSERSEAAEHTAGSAAQFDTAEAAEVPRAGLPTLWMVGEEVSPNVWWRDCSQPFASVLERQLQSRVPVARYTFYGNLQAGPVSIVYNLNNMTQLNENTQQLKRLRRVQELPAAMAL